MSEKRSLSVRFFVLLSIVAVFMLSIGLQAQETTGGLQGTVKDAGGAVVPKALVELTSPDLVGTKSLQTDGTGYYHFANLPPGVYTVTVKAVGFATLKREGVTLEVGHLPTLDLALKVGAQETVVEVSAEAPLIDVTTTRTVSNITEDVIADVPHGRSFQSVIQFAPSARNEPLAGSGTYGSAGGTGTGSNSPGNGGNGGAYGFSVAGGADSENSYLVEGQDTANLIGGYSHTNVPFEFIQEVQIKTSGIEAEHGGALGGVVNVIMKRGTNAWHGQFTVAAELGGLDGSPTAYTRFDPNGSVAPAPSDPTGPIRLDYASQYYQSKKDHTRDVQPAFNIGGPVLKDKVFLFLGFAPEYSSRVRTVNFGANDNNAGIQDFNQDTQTYYTNARIDAKVSNKLSVFGSYLSQYQRQSGENLPFNDSVNGLVNVSVASPLIGFWHGYGFGAPNTTINVGADFTITPRLISTTRFGYYFENYHDFGFPTSGAIYLWQTAGTTGHLCTPGLGTSCDGPLLSDDPTSVAAGLVQPNGYFTAGFDQNYTIKNSNKHFQFDQDLAWFKSGWLGTHNIKGGYQLNRISNDIYQRWNAPAVLIFPGTPSYSYYNGTTFTGTYGAATIQDFGTKGQATSYNHAFFVQDSWTIGKGVTIVAGIRFEHENVPAENNTEGLQATNPISFGWGSKIAPRLGFAWDVFRDGKLKVFGSHGVFNDQMKLNLAISSFGGQYWDNCTYEMNDPNYKDIVPAPDANARYCPNSDGNNDLTLGAYLTPTSSVVNGIPFSSLQNVFVDNINFRGNEGVVSGLKPYRQHEEVFGVDYQLKKNLAFEARWDRRRLDRVIEDAALFAQGNENFQIVNPGYGPNATNTDCGSLCPANIKAARAYDGFELRLTKSLEHNWYGMVSYTYSRLRGNYAGLTSTDLADGGGGRNSPNNSRSFDETYFQYDAYGKSSSGPLATDRPNTFKGYTYYTLPWSGKRAITNIGLFQTMYEGTSSSSYLDVGAFGGYPVYPEDRGKWASITQDPSTGNLTVTSVGVKRTPWFIQSDLSLSQDVKLNKNNEAQVLGFEVTLANLFNERSVTSYNSAINSPNYPNQILPGGYSIGSGAAYGAFEHAYPWKSLLNTDDIILNSQYGTPRSFQLARTVRFTLKYTF